MPIYRGNTLVGAVGTSGDGIDQDDMISFLGLYNGGQDTNTIAEAPTGIRSDQIVIQISQGSVRLRYVNCPVAPLLRHFHARCMQRQMTSYSLRAILLTTALLAVVPAWAQDQAQYQAKPDAAKSDGNAAGKTDSTAAKKPEADAKPVIIDAFQVR